MLDRYELEVRGRFIEYGGLYDEWKYCSGL
jgi:hypothetical protein